MCNGTSSRQSLGGTIAILKSPRLNESTPEMSLLLADDHHTGRTTATLSGINALSEDRQVVIQ